MNDFVEHHRLDVVLANRDVYDRNWRLLFLWQLGF